MIAKGTRAKSTVFAGRKEKTMNGLTKASLVINKRGKIVSKKSSANGKKVYKNIFVVQGRSDGKEGSCDHRLRGNQREDCAGQGVLREGQGHLRGVRHAHQQGSQLQRLIGCHAVR